MPYQHKKRDLGTLQTEFRVCLSRSVNCEQARLKFGSDMIPGLVLKSCGSVQAELLTRIIHGGHVKGLYTYLHTLASCPSYSALA